MPGRNRHSVCASPCVGRVTGSRTEEPSCRPLAGRRHVVDMPVLRAGRYGDRCDRFHQAGMIDRRLLAATCNSPHSAVMIRSSNNAQQVPAQSTRARHANAFGDDAFRSLLDVRQHWQHALLLLIVVRRPQGAGALRLYGLASCLLCVVGEVPSGCHLG